MTTKSTPGGRFREFRAHLGLTGQVLAQQLGVTKTAISYWETNRISLSKTACHLAEQLHRISATWLLEGTGPKWLPTPSTALIETSGLVTRPLLTSIDAFLSDGSVKAPSEHAAFMGLPRDVVIALLDSCQGGTPEDLYFVKIQEHDLEPTLFPDDWALVHTGLAVRESILDHSLYLVRLLPEEAPQVRRVAIDPFSHDLLVGVDVQTRIPIRIKVPATELQTMILGKVCWIGGRR